MASSWILRNGATDVAPIEYEHAAAVATDDTLDTVWLTLTPDELIEIAPRLGFHSQALEDATKATDGLSESAQRTRITRFEAYVFLTLFSSSLDPPSGELSLTAIPVFVSPKYVVMVNPTEPYSSEELLARWRADPSLLQYGVPTLLYCLLDLIVDSHLRTVDSLTDAVDEMEEDLFSTASDAASDPRDSQLRSFTNRKSLVRLRRVTQPMRELITGAMRHEDNDATPVPPPLMPYYQDLYDHVLRVADSIEGLRDLITTIYETRLALYDHTLNTVTRQLAAWAAIIAVPTAVTGFYGQNIPYPGFGRSSGYISSTVLWISISVLLYVMFRKRKWL